MGSDYFCSPGTLGYAQSADLWGGGQRLGIWVGQKGDLHVFMTAPHPDKAPHTSRVSLPAEGPPCVSLGVVAGQAWRLLGSRGWTVPPLCLCRF